MTLEREKRTTVTALRADLERKRVEKGYMLSQPIRVQPSRALLGNENLIKYLSNITEDEVKTWGTPVVIADTKIAGARGLLIIDKDTRDVKIISRSGKEKTFQKFVDKHKDEIVDGIDWKYVEGDVVLDGEIYAVDKSGHGVSQGRTIGYARNPEGKKLKGKVMVFDVLMVNNRDVRTLQLKERKKILDKAVDEEGGVVEEVDSETIKPTQIEGRFRQSMKRGEEGIVIKDPEQEYMSGKHPDIHWRKLKTADTLDLELKEVSSYPRNKEFMFYRHLVLVPSDNDKHEIYVDKGTKGAGLDFDYWKKKSKKWLKLYDRGIVRGKENVKVHSGYVDYYDRTTVPKYLIFPKKKREIFEIFYEDITDRYVPSGQKIVGERTDKKKADTMEDIKESKELFGKG